MSIKITIRKFGTKERRFKISMRKMRKKIKMRRSVRK